MSGEGHDAELEKLQEQIHKGTEETKTYLASLKTRLAEYDEHYKVSETATSFLQAGMDRAHKSVDELKELGDSLKQKSKDKSSTVVDAAKASFTRVQAALEALKESGRAYDQKFKSSVSNTVQSAKGGISSATTTVSSSIEHIVVATRERSSSSFEQLKEYLFSTQKSITDSAAAYGHGAVVVAGGVVTKAEQLDERYGVVGTISGAVAAVTEKVVGIDRALGVSERALMVDEKVSGGIGASLVNKSVEFVNSSVVYVTDVLQQAKVTAAEANGESNGVPASVQDATPAVDAEEKAAAPAVKDV